MDTQKKINPKEEKLDKDTIEKIEGFFGQNNEHISLEEVKFTVNIQSIVDKNCEIEELLSNAVKYKDSQSPLFEKVDKID